MSDWVYQIGIVEFDNKMSQMYKLCKAIKSKSIEKNREEEGEKKERLERNRTVDVRLFSPKYSNKRGILSINISAELKCAKHNDANKDFTNIL